MKLYLVFYTFQLLFVSVFAFRPASKIISKHSNIHIGNVNMLFDFLKPKKSLAKSKTTWPLTK